MLSDFPEILTTEEAADILRVGYNTLYDLLQSGKLKAYRNGRIVSVKPTPGLQTSAQHETIPPCSIVQCMAVPCTAGQTEVFS